MAMTKVSKKTNAAIPEWQPFAHSVQPADRTLHRVRRVDQLAGANIRRTISGSVWAIKRNGLKAADHSHNATS
jgi:hypothetical protein